MRADFRWCGAGASRWGPDPTGRGSRSCRLSLLSWRASPGRFSSRPDLFGAVADAVLASSRSSPLTIIFEDAHWADQASLALLEITARVTAGQRMLLLVTARDERVALPMGGGVRQLMLGGLDEHATRAMLARSGQEPTDGDVMLILRRTGGNPFLIAEVARLQSSRGGDSGVIPPAARTLLEHRLARLGEPSLRVLEAASVLGTARPGRRGARRAAGPGGSGPARRAASRRGRRR